jgi:DNA-directed RNA polymerase subunit F
VAKPRILSEEPVNMVMLRTRLEKNKGELSFRAQKTLEYLHDFVHLDSKKAEELYKKIDALKIPRVKDVHIHKIIDLMPTTGDDVKVVLQGYSITVKADNLKKIAELVSKYAGKEK